MHAKTKLNTDLHHPAPRDRPTDPMVKITAQDKRTGKRTILTPHENSAPLTSTGRNKVDPAVTCFVSMFPPVLYGGIVENFPFSPRATPISPQNGRRGIRIPFSSSNHAYPASRSSFHTFSTGACALNSSASRPKPGNAAVQPQSAGCRSRTSTWRTSPGSAETTKTGPLTGSSLVQSRWWKSVSGACPSDASGQSKVTVSPELMVITGGRLCRSVQCQYKIDMEKAARWRACCPRRGVSATDGRSGRTCTS
jgi:hypothetical protein